MFLKFFRKYFPDILDEFQKEYEKLIDSTTFDIIMTKAILFYSDENY
jgi:hypothetical protein